MHSKVSDMNSEAAAFRNGEDVSYIFTGEAEPPGPKEGM